MKSQIPGKAQIQTLMSAFIDKSAGRINSDLKALKKDGVFEIQFAGPARVAPFSGEQCIWHHCVRKLHKGFGETTYQDRSKVEDLIIIAPECTLKFSENRIEPYLKPTMVSEEFSQDQIFMVSEYILKEDQVYYGEITHVEWTRENNNFPMMKKQKHYLMKIYDQYPQNGKVLAAKIPPFGDLRFNG